MERRVSVVVINVRDRVHGYSPGQRMCFDVAKAKRLCETKHPNGQPFAHMVVEDISEVEVRNAGGLDAFLAAPKVKADAKADAGKRP